MPITFPDWSEADGPPNINLRSTEPGSIVRFIDALQMSNYGWEEPWEEFHYRVIDVREYCDEYAVRIERLNGRPHGGRVSSAMRLVLEWEPPVKPFNKGKRK